ncbi:MAG: membrane protein insertion efficiency factor YidD [Zetaproteobacteria bacterium]|nr:membrane protein insertion efficiency factor YidD [Zetaproteobacteria bacterium]
MKQFFIVIIKCYQMILSPMIPPRCRFFPTCSEYAIEAIERHGVLYGGGLALRRIFRCHPFGKSGIDLVP